jgi:hypothetical protein
MTYPYIVHYLIPSIALIFGAVMLLMGASTGAWIFYAIGGIVTLLAGWGFNMAYRHIQRHASTEIDTETIYPDHKIQIITDTGVLNIKHNPLQNHIQMPAEDPAPPV